MNIVYATYVARATSRPRRSNPFQLGIGTDARIHLPTLTWLQITQPHSLMYADSWSALLAISDNMLHLLDEHKEAIGRKAQQKAPQPAIRR